MEAFSFCSKGRGGEKGALAAPLLPVGRCPTIRKQFLDTSYRSVRQDPGESGAGFRGGALSDVHAVAECGYGGTALSECTSMKGVVCL